MTQTLDITPSPRVLRMLGQIDFAPWQCLAELIDNSIDAFIEMQRHGKYSVDPRISVNVPTGPELDRGGGVVAVRDNATGMTLDQLQHAVKAGYSGNDPVDKMGLFGMGFNISTARLGRRTQIVTSVPESPDWIRLTIDFDQLERTKTFHAPIELVPKSDGELQDGAHGTRIEISRLEPDRVKSLIWGQGRAKTKRRLGKIYGRVMKAMDITILYDGDRITPWRHCVWDKNRSVPTAEFGNVSAQIEIDATFDPRRFCTTCWVWLAETDMVCSSCGLAGNIIERPRRLKGWIGVQRYFDKEHYGIDLIRNGRVIEELDKSFFTFKDTAGDDLFEYPRDATHWGGRIVGELEIDFVRVSHQKDSFDKLDPEWKHVVAAVRGTSPLQPRIAERMSLGVNTSPMARLFAGYRKGIAGLKDLVPGDSKGVGINSGVVREYVEKFYAGEAAYQTDQKWYDLVLQAERAKRGESSGADEAAGELPVDEPASPSAPDGSLAPPTATAPPVAPRTEVDQDLSKTFELPMLPGSPVIVVSAYRHLDSDSQVAVSIRPDNLRVRYDYYPKATFFEESLQTPTDCLVADLAQHFLVVSAASPREMPVSVIAYEIRKKYFPSTLTDISTAAEAANSLLKELRAHFDEQLQSAGPVDVSALSPELVNHIRVRAFQAESAGEEQVTRLITNGQFARYLTAEQLLEIARRWPQLMLDGTFFSVPYSTLNENLRPNGLLSVLETLRDLVWLSDEAGSTMNKDVMWRLRYARALASLRLAESWAA